MAARDEHALPEGRADDATFSRAGRGDERHGCDGDAWFDLGARFDAIRADLACLAAARDDEFAAVVIADAERATRVRRARACVLAVDALAELHAPSVGGDTPRRELRRVV